MIQPHWGAKNLYVTVFSYGIEIKRLVVIKRHWNCAFSNFIHECKVWTSINKTDWNWIINWAIYYVIHRPDCKCIALSFIQMISITILKRNVNQHMNKRIKNQLSIKTHYNFGRFLNNYSKAMYSIVRTDMFCLTDHGWPNYYFKLKYFEMIIFILNT